MSTDHNEVRAVFANYGGTFPDLEGFRISKEVQWEGNETIFYTSYDGKRFAYCVNQGADYGLLSKEEFDQEISRD